MLVKFLIILIIEEKNRSAPKNFHPIFVEEGELSGVEVSTGSGPALRWNDLDKKYNKSQYETYRGGFFQRLKIALKYLFGKGDLK